MPTTWGIADGYDLIVFDFDGTIARLSVDWDGMKRELAFELGRPFDPLAKGLAALRTAGDTRSIDAYWNIVRRFEWGDPAGLAGNHAVIELLRAAHPERRVAICSSNARSTVERGLTRLKVSDCVDFIVGGDDVTMAKPHPEGLETILARLDADRRRTLFIGDSEVDFEAGTAAGVRTILVNEGALPDHV